jgi:transcriptional regulator with XRE-family HTH domain
MDRDKWSARQDFLQESLRELRKESQQTQVQLAKKLGRPQTYVSKYELGERRLDLFEINDICNACDSTLAEFIAKIEPQLKRYSALNERV